MDQMKTAYLANAPERQVVGPVRLPDGTYFLRLDGRRSGENVVAQASHILIGFGPSNNKDSAKAEAEKILKKARSGEDFAKLAQEFSEDKGSARNGGDLGFFGKGKMVKPFEDAVFAAKVGQIVGPVESQFGYHIIKVTDKKSDELKYSEIKIVPTISNPTRNGIFMAAHAFVNQVESGISFDTLAKRLNLQADTSDFMTKSFPLFGSWGLTNQIFDAEVGTILQPKEMKNSGIVIVQVIDRLKEGAPELSAFANEIKNKLVRKKQIAKLKEKANKIYNEVKSIGDLTLATNYEVKHASEMKNNGQVPGAGMDVIFTNKVFKSEVGKILEPIQGDGGWYIAQITSKNVPDENTIKNALPDQIKSMKQSAKGSVFNTWLNKIKENAKIEDMRGKFYSDF
jgi:parvulin-like peptidyl-prolyl isomerase